MNSKKEDLFRSSVIQDPCKLKYHTALCPRSIRSRNRNWRRSSSSKTIPFHRSSLPVGPAASSTMRESSNEHQTQPQQRDHHSIERERSSSCPNIEAERQLISGKEIIYTIRFVLICNLRSLT